MKKSLIAAALLFGCSSQALAVGSLAEVVVYDRAENRTLPVHFHEGRHYVVGRPGNEYRIDIRNRQPGDILTVVSVDGINAISGETATWRQAGYVMGAYTSLGISGWRKSLRRIAAFFFTELDNSYAARTGRPDDVGVIGVAVFRRKLPDPAVGISGDFRQRREAPSADAASPPPSAVLRSQPAPEKSLGTGHGRSETSVARYTRFERASETPDEVITIYYDSYRNLVAQGVIRDTPRIARPNPFPGRFVPDPR